jgi:starch synthase (maltosyl-transferring)
VTGETLRVEADLAIDGHDLLAARLQVRCGGDPQWIELPMQPAGPSRPDTWVGEVVLDRVGRWQYRVEAWVDGVATWRHGLEKKQAAGQDVKVDLLDGARLPPDAWRDLASVSEPLPLIVEPARARCSAWYELFPRSFGGLRGVIDTLPYVASMGFDVLYLPPIHPIGVTNRKGPNNTLTAGPDDPGSPWAIGAAAGGHEAVHPELGTLDDLAALIAAAETHGLALALDIAFQCSPGSASTPTGSSGARTDRSCTRRTRRRSTRTSTRSTSRPPTGRTCGRRSPGCSSPGASAACASSGSTTRTPSRSASGSGACARCAPATPTRSSSPRRSPGR